MELLDTLATRAPRATILLRLLVGAVFLPFSPRKIPILVPQGFWARTDWSMLLGSLFLLIGGAGPWSLDARLAQAAGGAAAARAGRG